MLENLEGGLHTISDRNKKYEITIRKSQTAQLKFDFFLFSCYNNLIGMNKTLQELIKIKLDFSLNTIEDRLNAIRAENLEDLSQTALSRAQDYILFAERNLWGKEDPYGLLNKDKGRFTSLSITLEDGSEMERSVPESVSKGKHMKMQRKNLNRSYEDTRGELAPLALLSQSFLKRAVDSTDFNAVKGRLLQARAANDCGLGDAPKGVQQEKNQFNAAIDEELLEEIRLSYDFSTALSAIYAESLSSSVLPLWRSIDELDYGITFWEMNNGKRRAGLAPRSELYERLFLNLSISLGHIAATGEFDTYLSNIESNAAAWSEREKGQWKKKLTEYRTEQYVLQDTIKGECIRGVINPALWWSEDKDENLIIDILPFSDFSFAFRYPQEENFSQEFMTKSVMALRNLDEKEGKEGVLDFRDPVQVKKFIQFAEELQDYVQKKGIIHAEMVDKALHWFQYFVNRCNLTPEEELILKFKIAKKGNKDIMKALEERGLTPYKENYISTVYTKRVLNAIAAQAQECQRMIEYITMGRGVFKECSECHRLIPRNSIYFNQRNNTKDGFYSDCKECRKKKRVEKAKQKAEAAQE